MEDDTARYCNKCTKSNDIDELNSTIQCKKIKFLTFSKTKNSHDQILTECLNNMINQKKIDNSSAYYD